MGILYISTMTMKVWGNISYKNQWILSKIDSKKL